MNLRRVLCVFAICFSSARAGATDRFGVHVIDEATGRGVPLVCLRATDQTRWYSDSNGWVAIDEPAYLNRDVWFGVSSYGYECPNQVLGFRGVTLHVAAGERAEVKLRRINIAERLYRVTGAGIYRDSQLLGEPCPTIRGDADGQVTGQDSAQVVPFRGRLYWFWGDTNRLSGPLGNFFTSGAMSPLPTAGGLDPGVGVKLDYFVDPTTRAARAMVAADVRPDSSPVWIDGLMTALDADGHEQMLAAYQRVKGLRPFERGLLKYNPDRDEFELLGRFPVNAPAFPAGHPFRAKVDGATYVYFPVPYPCVRVRDRWGDLTRVDRYEAFTCLRDGSAYSRLNPPIDRAADGTPVWKWRTNTAPLTPPQIEELVTDGALKRGQVPFRLNDAGSNRAIVLQGSSVCWNAYRHRWVMIGVQSGGDSPLGEVWFAESREPEGPWDRAVKVATHAAPSDNQDFYNPLQHPWFSQAGGKIVYFEGTYTHTFSGNPLATPGYDYNQLMYRLDLSDPRLGLDPPPKVEKR